MKRDYEFEGELAEHDASRMYDMATMLHKGADALIENIKLRKERDEWRDRYMKQTNDGLKNAHAMTGTILAAVMNAPKIAAQMREQFESE